MIVRQGGINGEVLRREAWDGGFAFRSNLACVWTSIIVYNLVVLARHCINKKLL